LPELSYWFISRFFECLFSQLIVLGMFWRRGRDKPLSKEALMDLEREQIEANLEVSDFFTDDTYLMEEDIFDKMAHVSLKGARDRNTVDNRTGSRDYGALPTASNSRPSI